MDDLIAVLAILGLLIVVLGIDQVVSRKSAQRRSLERLNTLEHPPLEHPPLEQEPLE